MYTPFFCQPDTDVKCSSRVDGDEAVAVYAHCQPINGANNPNNPNNPKVLVVMVLVLVLVALMMLVMVKVLANNPNNPNNPKVLVVMVLVLVLVVVLVLVMMLVVMMALVLVVVMGMVMMMITKACYQRPHRPTRSQKMGTNLLPFSLAGHGKSLGYCGSWLSIGWPNTTKRSRSIWKITGIR